VTTLTDDDEWCHHFESPASSRASCVCRSDVAIRSIRKDITRYGHSRQGAASASRASALLATQSAGAISRVVPIPFGAAFSVCRFARLPQSLCCYVAEEHNNTLRATFRIADYT